MSERRVITNRIFLIALVEMYRSAMKYYERERVLPVARAIADALKLKPLNVPVEGYYAEDEQLAEYFRLVRALQDVPPERATEFENVEAYRIVQYLLTSPLLGRPARLESNAPSR